MAAVGSARKSLGWEIDDVASKKLIRRIRILVGDLDETAVEFFTGPGDVDREIGGLRIFCAFIYVGLPFGLYLFFSRFRDI